MTCSKILGDVVGQESFGFIHLYARVQEEGQPLRFCNLHKACHIVRTRLLYRREGRNHTLSTPRRRILLITGERRPEEVDKIDCGSRARLAKDELFESARSV